VTTDNLLLSDTHHDENAACQVKSILLHVSSQNPIDRRSPAQSRVRPVPIPEVLPLVEPLSKVDRFGIGRRPEFLEIGALGALDLAVEMWQAWLDWTELDAPRHQAALHSLGKEFEAPIGLDVCKIAAALYQYTAIDDCSRWKVMGLYPRRSASSTLNFLDCLLEEMPFPIQRILPGPVCDFRARLPARLSLISAFGSRNRPQNRRKQAKIGLNRNRS
jgi:hypothetical protein